MPQWVWVWVVQVHGQCVDVVQLDEVMTVMVLRANNMACTRYGWVSHRALLRSFPFATVMKVPEQKWSSIYFVKLSNITWILQAFCTLLGTWPVSWTGPTLVLPGGPRGGCDGHVDQLLDSAGEVVAHACVVGGVACMHVGGVEFC